MKPVLQVAALLSVSSCLADQDMSVVIHDPTFANEDMSSACSIEPPRIAPCAGGCSSSGNTAASAETGSSAVSSFGVTGISAGTSVMASVGTSSSAEDLGSSVGGPSSTEARPSSNEPDSTSQREVISDAGAVPPGKEVLGAQTWTSGPLPVAGVAPPDLVALPGQSSGPPMVVSNNPEGFYGEGWLVQTARTDPTRGGSPHPMSGTFPLYLFHTNKSPGGAYVHVVVTNAAPEPVTVSMRGSWYTNTDYPCDPASGRPGQSYHVARDWLEAHLPVHYGPTVLAGYESASIAWKHVAQHAMLDGLFEITATGGVYVQTVVSYVNDPAAAVQLAHGAPAAGALVPPDPNEFGRPAGVYEHSKWLANFDVELPAERAHVGVCLVTSAKFNIQGVFLQDQTAPALMRLADSAERTYGNYGQHYHLKMSFKNASDTPRTVVVKFAHNVRNTAFRDFTWNGTVKIDEATVLNILTWPWDPFEQLATVTVPAQGVMPLDLEMWIPGLILDGAALLLETR